MASLEELQLSGAEVERLREAFGDPQFRSLFAEYAAEISDPAQRAVYEAEVAALERERGVEAHFLHPTAGWALRTSRAGSRRCYVNICSHPRVGRPRCSPGPGRGSTWTLPHCLSPPREELRRHRPPRLLYDVLFHPEALRLAALRPRLRRLLEDTAFDALDSRFHADLDRRNAVRLRGTLYKGVPQASLLRTPLPGGAPPPEEGAEGEASPLPPFPTPYAYPPPPPETGPAAPLRDQDRGAPTATTPRWSLRHRSHVDLQDYLCSRDSAPSPVPRELVLTVELPLLDSAAQAELEVRGRELRLDSLRPAAYSLRLALPYAVDEARGRAVFDRAARRLQITLPVLPAPRTESPAAEPPVPPRGSRPASPAALGSSPRPEGPSESERSFPAALLPADRDPLAAAGPEETSRSASEGAGPTPLTAEDPPEPRSAPSETAPPMPPARCPPFRCTQDEDSLRVALLVPHILPQSLRGRVGGEEYEVRFRDRDGAAFALRLRFAPGKELSAPEAELSVSPRNALLRLEKAPRSAGLWSGFSFGCCEEDLQERLFLTEDHVDGFLSDLTAASDSLPAAEEQQPQVEVLEVSEGKSWIRLKREEPLSFEAGEREETANPRKTDSDPESECGEHSSKAPDSPLKTGRALGSLQAGETMGSAAQECSHCSVLCPDDASVPEKKPAQPDSTTTNKEASATPQPPLKGAGEEGHSQSAGGLEGSGSRPVPPVLRETDMRDGSVQLITHHTTHCPVTFQNSLLYELD